MDQNLLTYSQASKYLGIRLSTLYALVCRHRIPHIRWGRRLVRFSPTQLQEWVNEHAVAPDLPAASSAPQATISNP